MEASEAVSAESAAIVEAGDEEALGLERDAIEGSDNGWMEGDPEDQPDNNEEARTA